MKHLLLLLLSLLYFFRCFAQEEINDEALRYQQQRMVFQQWDQNKFKPGKGFLGLNPYYWLVWGWPNPNYHKHDLRPLSETGPQTQRLALVAGMNTIDGKYKLQSDTVKNTALSEIANQSGLITSTDPLWFLYYNDQFKPVLDNSMGSILSGLPAQVSAKLVSEGLFSWYKDELGRLKERVQGARSADMDRGSRILAYHRLLMEYRKLSSIWAIRTSFAQATLDMTAQQLRLKSNQVDVPNWTPHSDIDIANKVLLHVK